MATVDVTDTSRTQLIAKRWNKLALKAWLRPKWTPIPMWNALTTLHIAVAPQMADTIEIKGEMQTKATLLLNPRDRCATWMTEEQMTMKRAMTALEDNNVEEAKAVLRNPAMGML